MKLSNYQIIKLYQNYLVKNNTQYNNLICVYNIMSDMNILPEQTKTTVLESSTTTTNPECCPCDKRSYYERAKDAARIAASSAKSMGSKAASMSMDAASSAARVGSKAAGVAARGTAAGLSGVGTLASGLARAPFMGMGGRKTRRHHGRRHKRKSGKKSRKHRHRRTRRK